MTGLGLGFDSDVDARLALGLDLVMLPPLVIAVPTVSARGYVIIDLDWGADHWFEASQGFHSPPAQYALRPTPREMS